MCKDSEITRHLTAQGNPKQNGLAERMNRTLLERVRCMLFHAKLPKSFWGEAVSRATYVINRSPSASIEFKTPYERWPGHKPSFDHLRVFGCLAYAHIKQGKLEPRAKKCLFIGYPTGVKGYKLWNLETEGPKTIVTRNVTFDEGSTMELSNTKVQPALGEESKSIGIEVQETVPKNVQEDSFEQDFAQYEESEEESDVDSSLGDQPNTSRYSVARDR